MDYQYKQVMPHCTLLPPGKFNGMTARATANYFESFTNGFCRMMLCISVAYTIMQCLSVCHVHVFCRNE